MMNNLINLDERLNRIEKLLISNKKVLTLEEACDYTGIKPSYMYKLTSSGKIPHSKPNGGAIYFDKEELETWMLKNKVKSIDEISEEAANYTFKNKK